ncbi:dTDP-4-dehydrorhamnose 3,5-epimerase [Reichenbachiella versicolor]|uniref:dTDP-4-dehydrorhamnose 3,5-epimerase n=1 Tax=Reichenbachiella versicolor TaxID=1821036 RepID=UPI000D6E66B5|nr:dTDP-4-dehydrorhamnose 3,5-epimerase [Reichenbachiella versicolor]
MKVKELELVGAYAIQPRLFKDSRGYFFEWLNTDRFKSELGVDFKPVQFNSSKSSKGVLRGMHFQNDPRSQNKLIAVTQGIIQDVVIDCRAGSPSFGKHYSEVLTEGDKNQLFIPRGFAHGFLVLSDKAEIFYAIDNFYYPESEGGVMYNDPEIGIKWELDDSEIILSDKDKLYKPFLDKDFNFKYND